MISTTTMKDAVAILDVLTRVKPNWLDINQLQLGLSRRRTHKALRFLQDQKMIQSRLEGFNEYRYKEYRVHQTDGFPAILFQEATQ